MLLILNLILRFKAVQNSDIVICGQIFLLLGLLKVHIQVLSLMLPWLFHVLDLLDGGWVLDSDLFGARDCSDAALLSGLEHHFTL